MGYYPFTVLWIHSYKCRFWKQSLIHIYCNKKKCSICINHYTAEMCYSVWRFITTCFTAQCLLLLFISCPLFPPHLSLFLPHIEADQPLHFIYLHKHCSLLLTQICLLLSFTQTIYLMCFCNSLRLPSLCMWVYCEKIKQVFNDNGLMCRWTEGDWNRMACWKIRSQHLQGANIIESRKGCLCASAVVNSPFVSQGPTVAAIVPLYRRNWIFFSIFFLPFFSASADSLASVQT